MAPDAFRLHLVWKAHRLSVLRFEVSPICSVDAGLLALGHVHGVNTAPTSSDPSDLQLAKELMFTCYSMYLHVPAGLAPELVFFNAHDGSQEHYAQHKGSVGGGEFSVKPQVTHRPFTHSQIHT